ncbi:MAG: DUF72 domain-containing protein [Gammaproteobacteria bacterium]|nr:DUF72 domain-containing protein [Gammaproteobacteria bacterium]
MAGNIFIGTSGWHHPHWKGPFYPNQADTASWLSFYSKHLHVVEVNHSFHQLPESSTIDHWREQTADDFRFAVQAPRAITHLNRLRNCDSTMGLFLGRMERFGRRLGPIFFQLPPDWHCNTKRLSAFLDLLPDGYRYAFEFRDRSWHTEETYRILKERNIAFCIYDLGGVTSPLFASADFVYARLHGPLATAHSGNYSSGALNTWAGRVKRWSRREKRDVFLFFNNDEAAYAPRNARLFRTLVENREPEGDMPP